MILLPREIISKIADLLDVCSFRSLCMSNKYLYESYLDTNRAIVSFMDVPLIFRKRIKNFKNFCVNVISLDVSETSIDTFELCRIVTDSPSLIKIIAYECPNIKNGKLFVILATKKNKKCLNNRKIHIELSVIENKTLNSQFYEIFTGILTSNVFDKPELIICNMCRNYYHRNDLIARDYIIHDYHYVNACPGCTSYEPVNFDKSRNSLP